MAQYLKQRGLATINQDKYAIHEWDSRKINGMFSCWVTDIENRLKVEDRLV